MLASLYGINITLNGEVKLIRKIGYFTGVALGANIEIMTSFTMEYVTEPLPAGTYTINMTWGSLYSIGSTDSQLIFCHVFLNSSRSLLVQEIHI